METPSLHETNLRLQITYLALRIVTIDFATGVIARVIKGEHGYKANTEVLIEKLYDLIANGLDDTIPDWNEVRQAELNKYINSQKRAGRKKRKSKEKPTDLAGNPAPATTEIEKPLQPEATPATSEDPNKQVA